MKPLSLSTTGQPLARHEDRARRSHARNFPQTNYHFHAPAEDVVTVRDQHRTVGTAELRAFRQLSNEYLSEKTHRGYVVEILVFAIVAGLFAWQLISLLILLAQTANG